MSLLIIAQRDNYYQYWNTHYPNKNQNDKYPYKALLFKPRVSHCPVLTMLFKIFNFNNVKYYESQLLSINNFMHDVNIGCIQNNAYRGTQELQILKQ